MTYMAIRYMPMTYTPVRCMPDGGSVKKRRQRVPETAAIVPEMSVVL